MHEVGTCIRWPATLGGQDARVASLPRDTLSNPCLNLPNLPTFLKPKNGQYSSELTKFSLQPCVRLPFGRHLQTSPEVRDKWQ